METIEARTKASEFNAELLEWAWESLTLEDLMEKYGTDEGGAMAIMFALGTATIEMHWEYADGDCTCEHDDDDLDDFEVGDPDPTLLFDDTELCCPETNGALSCTRIAGHPGQHIAGDGLNVVGVWE